MGLWRPYELVYMGYMIHPQENSQALSSPSHISPSEVSCLNLFAGQGALEVRHAEAAQEAVFRIQGVLCWCRG